jgi:hypothetical protein
VSNSNFKGQLEIGTPELRLCFPSSLVEPKLKIRGKEKTHIRRKEKKHIGKPESFNHK